MGENLLSPILRGRLRCVDPYDQDHQLYTDAILVDQQDAGDGDAGEPWQGRLDDSTSRDSSDVLDLVISGGYAGIGTVLSDDTTQRLTGSSLLDDIPGVTDASGNAEHHLTEDVHGIRQIFIGHGAICAYTYAAHQDQIAPSTTCGRLGGQP